MKKEKIRNKVRYGWHDTAYINVAKKILDFREKLNPVSIEVVASLVGVPTSVFTHLGNKKRWFTDIPPKYWKTLHLSVNGLFVEGTVVKDYRRSPVGVIEIKDLKMKKTITSEKLEKFLAFSKRTFKDPKTKKVIHIVTPNEINTGDQETSMDKADVEIVKKETLAVAGGNEYESKIDLKVRTGNFVWSDKEHGMVEFVECPDGKFKVYEEGGRFFPVGSPDPKEDVPLALRGVKTTNGNDLSAKALMEIDDQVRKIIKEELPPIVEKIVNNIKFEIELPVKIKV